MKGLQCRAVVLLAGCAPPAASEVPKPSSLTIVFVCPSDRDTRAEWPAPRFPGALFSVASVHGYLATVRLTASEVEIPCDECFGPSVEAELVDGQWSRYDDCQPGVGPVRGPLRQQRIIVKPSADVLVEVEVDADGSVVDSGGSADADSDAPTEQWRDWLEIDLDGDGRADLAGAERCDHFVPSKCNKPVCDRLCRGVRATGAPDSEVRPLGCLSYVPDALELECL